MAHRCGVAGVRAWWLLWLVWGTAGSPQDGEGVLVSVPFAQTALWASSLKGLAACDHGIDDNPDSCPARPEHGGAGFLSSVFTWRYALNNLRAALVAASHTVSSGQVGSQLAPPQGAPEATLQLLAALDELMERPVIATFGEITQAARSLFVAVEPFLAAQP